MSVIRSLLARVRRKFATAADAGLPLALYVKNDPSSGIDNSTFVRVVLACAIQLQRDVAPTLGMPAPSVTPVPTDGTVPGTSQTVPHLAVLCVVGHIPDDPNAQGWHQPLGTGDEYDGFVSTEGVDVDGFAECLGHELIETARDPDCTRVYVRADGSRVADEPCVDGGQKAPESGEERGDPQISSSNFFTKFLHRRRSGVVR